MTPSATLLCFLATTSAEQALAQFTAWEWVSPFPDCYPTDMVTDDEGNTYAAMFAQDTVAFGGLPPQQEQSSILAKYAPNGSTLWAIPVHGAYIERITVRNNVVYAVGNDHFWSPPVSIGAQTLPPLQPGHRMFILSAFTDQGVPLWTNVDTTSGTTYVYDLEVNDQEEIFMATRQFGFMFWNGDSILHPFGNEPTILKYGPGGTKQWYAIAKVIGGVGFAAANGIAPLSDGGAIVCGEGAWDTCYFDTMARTPWPYFLARLDDQGQFVWAHTAADAIPEDVDATTDDSVYVAGLFSGTTYAFGSPLSTPSADMFVAKAGSDGGISWVHRSHSYAWGVETRGKQLCVDPNGRPVVAGGTIGGSVLSGDTLPDHAVYVQKLTPQGEHMETAVMWAPGGSVGVAGVGADNYGRCYIGGAHNDHALHYNWLSIPVPPTTLNQHFVARTGHGWVGLQEPVLGTFSLFPNPTAGAFTLQHTTPFDEVTICDAAGRTVLQQRFSPSLRRDLSVAARGLFICTLWREGVSIGRARIAVD